MSKPPLPALEPRTTNCVHLHVVGGQVLGQAAQKDRDAQVCRLPWRAAQVLRTYTVLPGGGGGTVGAEVCVFTIHDMFV